MWLSTVYYYTAVEYVQPSFGDDGEACCMDVLVTLVESPASFYVQFTGEDYSVSSSTKSSPW